MASTKPESSLKPLIELTIASLFWGFGFIGTVWALKFISPSAVIFYRFFFAALTVIIIRGFQKRGLILWEETKRAWPAGLVIAVTLVLQSWGLKFTTATKSSFITTLYVIIVPILSSTFLGERLRKLHWFYVGMALTGTILILELKDFSLSLGDTLTLGNAFLAAVHILLVDKASQESKDAFAFNGGQAVWCALLTFPLLIYEDNWNLMSLDGYGWVGLVTLTFGSSLIAFFLQVKAQKDLSPSVASILFLMESPFSWIFAIWLLREHPSFIQCLGAVMIFTACALTAMSAKPKLEASP